MPRQPREIKSGYCYHITNRCNNREFKLTRHECREVFLFAIKKAITKINIAHFWEKDQTLNESWYKIYSLHD